jgi:hypothetical protein
MSQNYHSPVTAGSARAVGVEREARELAAKDWCVRAVARGWPAPEPLDGHRPDIYATRKGATRVAVVAGDCTETDRGAALRAAAERRGADFYLLRVGEGGRRVEYTSEFD